MRLAVIRPATVVILFLLSASLGTAAAQPAGKVPRIGYLSQGFATDLMRARFLEAFRQGLRELGYVEGQNIAIESRWAEGKYDRYPALAADLVRLKVDVIVAQGGAATQAAQQATRTIPIVMSTVAPQAGSPVGGHGAPICWYWRSDADGVATWGPSSRPVPQWTRPGATPVKAHGRQGHHH